METVLSRLQLDHANMSRLLDIVDAQLQLVADAQNADFELMRDILHYLTNYSDAIHHPTEDLLYARLADVSVSARKENSGVLVRPMTTAPAALRLLTTGASPGAITSLKASTPFEVAQPVWSTLILIVKGTP